ncbi:MAG: linear amide C-N hydrolase [Anaerolineae bacterium]|nr:linear amide C-N hydrolase [Anaerolineae bacterium]NIN96779.1 linear amide C-N hydrolase [Anaerolineae bacterium]NIQ79775.1 linear amide C-N hydrolase [Anaerolineae bacterium]
MGPTAGGNRPRKTTKIALCVVLAAMVVLAVISYSPLRTLSSLRKADDYPLYVMSYHGGYLSEPFLNLAIPEDIPHQVNALAKSDACTCFAALNPEGEKIFGRNFDWYRHPSLLLFTDPPNAYASVSMVDIHYLGYGMEDPSLVGRTRLLLAPYLPFDGMNEAGLVVGMMAVPYARASDDFEKPTMGSLRAIRLLLDHAASVDEALSLLEEYNIVFHGPPLHYLISDSSGESAVVEFVDGKTNVVRNDREWQVATNFIISAALPDGANAPCSRYNRAYEALEQARASVSEEQATAILESGAQPHTIWSAVYDISGGDVQLVVGGNYERVHTFELQKGETPTR